jgi:peptide/nickel transport system ATP-binding protein
VRRAAQILRGETPNPVSIPPGCRFRPRCPIAEDRCAETDPPLGPPASDRASGREVACLLA